MEDDGGLFNHPSDPKRQKPEEKETKEEKDSGTLSSLDDLKAIRKKIQEHIDYWKNCPYEKRTLDPWNFNHLNDLYKISDDYVNHGSLAGTTTQDILDELKLFKVVIDDLEKDRWAFLKFLRETYYPQWTLNLVKLYKLGMDDVVANMDEDVAAGKPDRYYLLECITEEIEPVWQNKDLEDTTDETYEDLVKELDKLRTGIDCSGNFVDEEYRLEELGKSVIWCMAVIVKRLRGVHKYKTLGVGATTATAANMHVDCQTSRMNEET